MDGACAFQTRGYKTKTIFKPSREFEYRPLSQQRSLIFGAIAFSTPNASQDIPFFFANLFRRFIVRALTHPLVHVRGADLDEKLDFSRKIAARSIEMPVMVV